MTARPKALDKKQCPSANWGQIIAINLFTPPIIGYYWLLLAIIAIIGLQKVLLLLAIIGLHPYH